MFIIKRLGYPYHVARALEESPKRALQNMKTVNGEDVVWFLEKEIGMENFGMIARYLFVYQPLPGANFYFLSAVPLPTLERLRVTHRGYMYKAGETIPTSTAENKIYWLEKGLRDWANEASCGPAFNQIIAEMVADKDESGLRMLYAQMEGLTSRANAIHRHFDEIVEKLLKEYAKDSAAPGSPMEKTGPLYSRETSYGNKKIVEHFFHPATAITEEKDTVYTGTSKDSPFAPKDISFPVDPKLPEHKVITYPRPRHMNVEIEMKPTGNGFILSDEPTPIQKPEKVDFKDYVQKMVLDLIGAFPGSSISATVTPPPKEENVKADFVIDLNMSMDGGEFRTKPSNMHDFTMRERKLPRQQSVYEPGENGPSKKGDAKYKVKGAKYLDKFVRKLLAGEYNEILSEQDFSELYFEKSAVKEFENESPEASYTLENLCKTKGLTVTELKDCFKVHQEIETNEPDQIFITDQRGIQNLIANLESGRYKKAIENKTFQPIYVDFGQVNVWDDDEDEEVPFFRSAVEHAGLDHRTKKLKQGTFVEVYLPGAQSDPIDPQASAFGAP